MEETRTIAPVSHTPYSPVSHTPYSDLDLLLNEADAEWVRLAPLADDEERPDTVDAMNAQILAGLVSP
jgi:hypothetical protein